MADPKSEAPKKKTGPDALVASPDVTLTEEELSKVSGGAEFLKLSGVDGESTDDKHKGEIELMSRTLKR
jgi:bacteriocin-like protein